MRSPESPWNRGVRGRKEPVGFLGEVERHGAGVALAMAPVSDALPALQLVRQRAPAMTLLLIASGWTAASSAEPSTRGSTESSTPPANGWMRW